MNTTWQIPNGLMALSEKFGHSFANSELLLRSITHTSYAFENKMPQNSNERLEFLGDSVLSLMVSEHLFHLFGGSKEGTLSKMRSALVNEERLCQLSQFLGLGEHLLLGAGEDKSGGRTRSKNLSRAFEALLGAVFIDSNFEVTKKFFFNIVQAFEEKHGEIFSKEILNNFDPKTRLQEEVLKNYSEPPKYECEPLENEKFKVQLFVDGRMIEEAIGDSRKRTEKELAIAALENKTYQISGDK